MIDTPTDSPDETSQVSTFTRHDAATVCEAFDKLSPKEKACLIALWHREKANGRRVDAMRMAGYKETYATHRTAEYWRRKPVADMVNLVDALERGAVVDAEDLMARWEAAFEKASPDQKARMLHDRLKLAGGAEAKVEPPIWFVPDQLVGRETTDGQPCALADGGDTELQASDNSRAGEPPAL